MTIAHSQLFTMHSKNSKFKTIYFCLIVYKNEFDLINVFDRQMFQARVDECLKADKLKQDQDGKDAYVRDLLLKYEVG